MWVRLHVLSLAPGRLDDFEDIFHGVVVPDVQALPGNIDVWLLEPVERTGNRVIILTSWESRAEADRDGTQGTVTEMAEVAGGMLTGPPQVTTYEVTQ